MQQGIAIPPTTLYPSKLSSCDEHLQSGNVSCVKKTKPDEKCSLRYSDMYYEYDLEHGTQLNDRNTGIVLGSLLLSSTITMEVTFIALILSTLTPLYFLTIPFVLILGAAAFSTYIKSTRNLQHAQQVLGPKTQEQAEALQCKAIEICTYKQEELNKLQAKNALIKADMKCLSKECHCEPANKCKYVTMDNYTRIEKSSALFRKLLANNEKIGPLEASLTNLQTIYHLKIDTDEKTGKVFVQQEKPVRLEELPV